MQSFINNWNILLGYSDDLWSPKYVPFFFCENEFNIVVIKLG
jgi:hypothetical protein